MGTANDAASTRARAREAAVKAVEAALAETELEFEQPAPTSFVVSLPGERKLRTTCSLVVGDHTLSLNAFVARRPDENHEGVYRWLLERNTRLGMVTFALDHLGDVYLVGRLPLGQITPEVVDQLFGETLAASDESFNELLELGFATAIRREWQWRVSRGESLANLAAFSHLIDKASEA
jgi:hypothetical protein